MQVWDSNRSGKEGCSFGLFGIIQWRSMNEDPGLPRSPSQSNVFYASLIPVNRSNIGSGIASRAWWWATFIMHKLCGVRTSRYYSFSWKQTIFGERIPWQFSKKTKVWNLLRGITMWTVWIVRNDRVFNHVQWNKAKVKHHIWNDLILYAKGAWDKLEKNIKISEFSAEALLQGFDRMWGTENMLCRHDILKITWNWR